MNRNNNVPFKPAVIPQGAVPLYTAAKPGSMAFNVNRVPQDFREAMKHISAKQPDNQNMKASEMAAKAPQAPKSAVSFTVKSFAKSSVPKWKPSFQLLDKQECNTEDQCTLERTELYDPYNAASSDSEHEMLQGRDRSHSPPNQDNNPEPQSLSPSKGRWDKPYPKTATSSQGPGHRPANTSDAESLVSSGFGSASRVLDHRVGSPDRLIHGSERFPQSFGVQRTNGEERITIPEYRREMIATGRLSPSRLKQSYQHQLGYMETGLDEITPSRDMTRYRSKRIVLDKCPIMCDLCDVEVASSQELLNHLESKTHWDTLEHVQQQNNYDDMTIAFLQEFMLHRSSQHSRAIEDGVLHALQENDHMTKIEIFHCAACNIFVSTSASSVRTHITSQEHISNTKEFEVQQRLACLDKAQTMMEELKPQFEHFLKGGTSFE